MIYIRICKIVNVIILFMMIHYALPLEHINIDIYEHIRIESSKN